MRTSVEFKNFELEEGVRLLIERLAERIERRTKRLSPTMLRIALEEMQVHRRYRVSITLDVPWKTLSAIDEAPTLEPAIRAAFAEVERQVQAHKALMHGEQWWKHFGHRQEVRELKETASVGEEDFQRFHAAVDPHLPTLTHYARHLVRYAESRGDLPTGELDPEDLVTDVLVRAYAEWIKKPPSRPVRGWLIQMAERQIQEEIRRYRQEHSGTISVDRPAPETPPSEAVTRLGEEQLDFYQPDEALKIEDILPDIRVPSPEEELQMRELRRCVREGLNKLPKDQRRALILRYVLGFRTADLAQSMRMREAEVVQMIEDARSWLRDQLLQKGCTFDPHGVEHSPSTAWNLTEKQLK
jgi:RNA polymerase sigma factor (sigma-70 family)